MLTVETRYAISPVEARSMDTGALRDAFLCRNMFRVGEIRLVYSHYDRMILGGAIPDGMPLCLDHVAASGTASLLDRREMAVVNIGDAGSVATKDATYQMLAGDVLYLPMGSGAVTFSGMGRFYILSAPAHAAYPARLLTPMDAKSMTIGAAETANHRTIHQFIHPDVMPSCQLVVGYTRFHGGSVWNTMPAHRHDRRMEAYLYFDMPADRRVVHLMGEPSQTRHLIVANEEATLSPPWSIHCGAGTGSYAFVWAMAGDNVDYRDMDPVPVEALR